MRITQQQLSLWRAESLWKLTLDKLFNEIDRKTFSNYIETLKPISFMKGTLILTTSSEDANHLANNEYSSLILDTAAGTLGSVKQVQVLHTNELAELSEVIQSEYLTDLEYQKAQDLWEQVLDQMHKNMNRALYKVYEESLKPIAVADDTYVISSERTIHRLLGQHGRDTILTAIQEVDDSVQYVELVLPSNKTPDVSSWSSGVEKTTASKPDETTEKDLWSEALERISENISKPSFDTWFKPTKLVSYDQNRMVIAVPNDFARDWLESRYQKMIMEVIKEMGVAVDCLEIITVNNSDATNNKDQQMDKPVSDEIHVRLNRIEQKLDQILSLLEKR